MQKLPVVILFFLVCFGALGATLFTPALPTIQQFFHVSVADSQFTMTSYLVGYSLGQLPYGPLANGFGRKKALVLGLGLSVIASLLCAFSAAVESFGILVFARFLQALGCSAGLKLSYTMVSDTYDQKRGSQIISLFVIAFAIVPGFGIALGGWLTEFFSWQSCFYFLAFVGLFFMWLTTFLPETAHSIDRNALKLSSIIEGYKVKFSNKQLVLSALMIGCQTSVVYTFASKAPFIGIQVIGLTPESFGMYNLIPPVGMIIGAFLTYWLSSRFAFIPLVVSGIATSLLAVFSMFIPFLALGPSTTALFFPMMMIYVSQAMVFPTVSSFGLSTAENKANAAAVLNFINIGVAVIALLLSKFIFPEAPLYLPIMAVISYTLMLVLGLRLKISLQKSQA